MLHRCKGCSVGTALSSKQKIAGNGHPRCSAAGL